MEIPKNVGGSNKSWFLLQFLKLKNKRENGNSRHVYCSI